MVVMEAMAGPEAREAREEMVVCLFTEVAHHRMMVAWEEMVVVEDMEAMVVKVAVELVVLLLVLQYLGLPPFNKTTSILQ
jgi:hypothetical protein